MKHKKIAIINLLVAFLLLSIKQEAQVQSKTFYYDGVRSTSSSDNTGTIQTWQVPPCVSLITVIAVGGSGGTSTSEHVGGKGAIVTGTVTVVSGDVLNIIAAGKGANCTVNNGGGGGGGSFVWDNNTSTLLVAAGGGGGAGAYAGTVTGGPGADAQTNNTSALNLATPTVSTLGSCAPGGTGGGGSSGGQAGQTTFGGTATSSDGGPACGGAGWGENGGEVGAGTWFYANGFGVYPDSAITPGYGGQAASFNTGAGGYGGGAAGGFNGGGGAGGYNGGGGGNGQNSNNAGWGGGGGGSYVGGGTAISVTLGQADSNGYVTILWVPGAGTASITGSTNVSCNGNSDGSAIVTATGGGPYTYTWTPSGGTTNIATGLSAGTYTVSVSSGGPCSATASVTITQPAPLTVAMTPTPACFGVDNGSMSAAASGGTAPYTYLWSNGATTNAITGLAPGTYSIGVADANGCTSSNSATVTQNPPLTVTASASPSSVCSGSPTVLTASSGGVGVSYVWAPSTGGLTCNAPCNTATVSPTGNTLFTVIGTDANGCTGAASVTVSIITPPSISAVSSKPSLCKGESVNLQALGTNITSAYMWQPGSEQGAVVQVTPSVTTTYTVSASNACGLVTAPVTISVNNIPNTAFTADNTKGCAALCVQLRDHSTLAGGSITSWSWNFGDGDSSNIQSPIHCYDNPGEYTVDLTTTSDSGCSSTLKIVDYITAYSRPNAGFSYSPNPVNILEPTVQFTDKSTDAYSVVQWEWSFGDNSDSTSYLKNPVHTYPDTGTYCTNEIVTNIHGCTDTATECFAVNPIFSLYIPSSFSPNGDGHNDVFIPKGSDIKSFEMYIFDRWGIQLYHTTDINEGWNGKYGGVTSQEDVYEYLINVYDHHNIKHSYIGSVTLIK